MTGMCIKLITHTHTHTHHFYESILCYCSGCKC